MPMPLQPDLATKLREMRIALGLTQQQAAAASGIPYGTYLAAEQYGKMGFKVRSRVTAWLANGGSKPSTRKEVPRVRERT